MSKKDQYHHFIPRFILREFQTGAKKTNKERQEEFKKTGVVNERVYFYDLKKASLENRLIGTVYGVTNLYRDVTNIQQVDEIEEKFSKLESHCAKLIQGLHKRLDGSASERRTFPITRQDLGQLRKFLFLMHFRNSGLQGSYFDPEHPHHRGIRDVLEKRWAQAEGAKTAKDVWLHATKYYLDTPHSQILLQVAERTPRSTDIFNVLKTLNPHTIENADLMDAITYFQQADMYYLSIIQAAPGHEFVLGNNTFGLWEGIMGMGAISQHGIHRIYVASPRIALVLRLNLYLHAETPQLLKNTNSNIISIKLPSPTCTFAFSGSENMFDMAQYRASPAAQNDLFTFPITKLTAAQTFLVNTVVMQNIGLMGSLTFKDPACMRITLRQFWRLDVPLNRIMMRMKYSPLMWIIGSAIRDQPENFDMPLTRVFMVSEMGGGADITTVAALSKAAARKKKKGKGKHSSVSEDIIPPASPIAESPQAEAPGDRIMTLALKRMQGNISNIRERYEDSLEAWNIMQIDEPAAEINKTNPYKSLFLITAARFKKLAEPFLLVARTPGFAPAPNAQLKTSSEIASDATIKAIFDSGGKWFDKWEDKFRLHVGEEEILEELMGIRNTKHLLRDLLIIEIITWLARRRHDILQQVVIPDLSLSLYLST